MHVFRSHLISQEKTYLSMFSWDKLLGELEENAPILLAILRECTQTKVPRPNQMSVIGMCAAIVLKYRYSKMSLVQKIISIILHGGHRGKLVSLNLD